MKTFKEFFESEETQRKIARYSMSTHDKMELAWRAVTKEFEKRIVNIQESYQFDTKTFLELKDDRFREAKRWCKNQLTIPENALYYHQRETQDMGFDVIEITYTAQVLLPVVKK